jgi:hypothetical protein
MTRDGDRIGSLAERIAELEAEKLAGMQEACWFERSADGAPLPGYLERRRAREAAEAAAVAVAGGALLPEYAEAEEKLANPFASRKRKRRRK